ERLLTAEVHQGAGVLGHVLERDPAVLGAHRCRGAEALVLGRAGRKSSGAGRGGGQEEGTTTREARAFHGSRIASRPWTGRARRSGCERRDLQTSAASSSRGSQVRIPPARQPRSRT